MSSDGDLIAVQNSVQDNLADAQTVYFHDKSYTFITDSTSNSGSFSSGQIQFDLSTLNSQSQWINLPEAVIEFPVKVTARLTTAAGVTSAALNASTIIKNGWHHWIDSAQLIINGQTIQSAQPWENVAASFRILSSWSQDTLRKWGSSTGVALDDLTADTTVTNTSGLNNATYSTVATASRGFDAINNSLIPNKGAQARNSMTNTDISPASASIQTQILGSSGIKTEGRSHVASSGNQTTNNADMYSAYYMATVRLKDICDISDFPMTKNLKGFLYLSFNSTQVSLTGSGVANTLASTTVTPLTGRTCPFTLNTSSTGIQWGAGAAVIQVTGSVDATSTNAVGTSGPLLTNARLLCPYYIANPSTDSMLTKPDKFFTTMEKIVNPLTVVAGGSANFTITTGVPNPRRLVMLPMWQNLGGATFLTNPEVSPFDTVPATSGPFAAMNNLQVYVANKPIYQYPIQYSFEQWVSENSQVGLNGNLVNEDTSGLLSQQLFEQNHRFYTVDLSRRTVSEDGASKSIQVSFQNPSSSFGMKVICIVFYEKQWVINTATCQLQNV